MNAERTTLQFPKEFVKYLEKVIPNGVNKNFYIMLKCGYIDKVINEKEKIQ